MVVQFALFQLTTCAHLLRITGVHTGRAPMPGLLDSHKTWFTSVLQNYRRMQCTFKL